MLSASSGSGSKNHTLSCIGEFLVSQLQVEYELKGKICGHEARIAQTKLNDQIIAYAKCLWPFDQTLISQGNIAKYWTDLLEHNGADVLVISHQQTRQSPVLILSHPVLCDKVI